MSEIRIELIYDGDCPNVPIARENITKAIGDTEGDCKVQEWDRSRTDSPPYAASYGSPTVLVNGADVSGEDTKADAKSCRVYLDESGGMQGTPTATMIQRAIVQAGSGREKPRGTLFAGMAAILTTLGAVSIPALICPACWPAYIGLLGALGISYFDFTPYLIPSIVVSVMIALTAIGYQSYRSRSRSTFALGVTGALLVLSGRFWLLSDPITYLGVAVLVGSIIVDSVKRNARTSADCCPTEGGARAR